MALTAQKVALMVLMLGLMMMGVTVLALAGEAPLPTGRESFQDALTKASYVEVQPPGTHVVSYRQKLNSSYVQPATETIAVEDTVLPEPFPQQLD